MKHTRSLLQNTAGFGLHNIRLLLRKIVCLSDLSYRTEFQVCFHVLNSNFLNIFIGFLFQIGRIHAVCRMAKSLICGIIHVYRGRENTI